MPELAEKIDNSNSEDNRKVAYQIFEHLVPNISEIETHTLLVFKNEKEFLSLQVTSLNNKDYIFLDKHETIKSKSAKQFNRLISPSIQIEFNRESFTMQTIKVIDELENLYLFKYDNPDLNDTDLNDHLIRYLKGFVINNFKFHYLLEI